MDKFFKNTFIFYVFFQLLIFNSFGQNHEIGMTTKELNLNGEVRSIRESKFKAINKEGIITKGDLDSYGFIIQRIFNHNGNEIERLLFMNNGSLSQKFVSTYDSLGKLNNFKSKRICLKILF